MKLSTTDHGLACPARYVFSIFQISSSEITPLKGFSNTESLQSLQARRKILLKFADIIDENADELATLEVIDGGKLFGPVRYFEVPISSETFRYFAGAADKIRGATLKMSSSIQAYTLREPIGVVGHIIPWNGPAYMFATKVAPALAAGCTMVVKPAEQTPLTVLFFAHLSKLVRLDFIAIINLFNSLILFDFERNHESMCLFLFECFYFFIFYLKTEKISRILAT